MGERIDLAELKDRLSAVLRENKDEYWSCLRAYTQAKLTKPEFDHVASSLLGENVSLHNTFIKAILSNAYNAVSTSTSQGYHHASRRRPPFDVSPVQLKKKPRMGARADQAAQVPVRQRHRVTARPPERPPNDHYPRFPHEFGGSFTLWALRNRMFKTAHDAGLNNVSPDAVALMMHALEYHLKNVVANVLQVPRAKRTRTFTYISEPHAISPRNLLTTMQTKPYLLGEDLPVNQERILLMQEDEEVYF